MGLYYPLLVGKLWTHTAYTLQVLYVCGSCDGPNTVIRHKGTIFFKPSKDCLKIDWSDDWGKVLKYRCCYCFLSDRLALMIGGRSETAGPQIMMLELEICWFFFLFLFLISELCLSSNYKYQSNTSVPEVLFLFFLDVLTRGYTSGLLLMDIGYLQV